jgi:hypothetical protein
MMAPIPSAVSDQGPRVFCRRCPGASDSEISLSIDLQQKSWFSDVRTVAAGSVDAGSVDDGDKTWLSPQSESGMSATPMPSVRMLCLYRFDWPRTNFFTLRFFDPRA